LPPFEECSMRAASGFAMFLAAVGIAAAAEPPPLTT
jgi:hypothetical protein